MAMPSIDFMKQLVDKLKSGDIGWFKEQWKSGGLSFLTDHLPGHQVDEVGKGIEAGDLNPLKKHMGSVKIPGMPDLGNLTGAVTGAAGAVTGAAGAAAGAAGAAAGAVAGKVGGAAGKVSGAVPSMPTKKAFDPKLLIPVVILAALAAFGLSRCGKDDVKKTGDSVVATASEAGSAVVSEAGAAVSEAVSAETTVAP
jgi:hypothetical protein